MITENKHKQIARDNARENTGRIEHTYNIGDKVLRIKRGIKGNIPNIKVIYIGLQRYIQTVRLPLHKARSTNAYQLGISNHTSLWKI
jgi:hypothetical protein